MRPIRHILFLIPLLFLTAGTSNKPDCYIAQEKNVFLIGNSLMAISIDRKNGSIKGLRTGRGKLLERTKKSGAGGLFSIFVSASTDMWRPPVNAKDKWEEYVGTLIKSSSQKLDVATPEVNGEHASLTLVYNKVGKMNITVEVTIQVRAKDPVATFKMKLTNKTYNIVTAVVFPEILNLRRDKRASLAWPQGRGKIFKGMRNEFFRLLPYPSPASMQWLYYRLPTSSGLYIGVLDAAASYKEFRFGLDKPFGESRRCAVTFWPFVQYGRNWTSPTVEVGLLEGTWHLAAERYRKWLVETAKWVKKHPKWITNLHGIGTMLIKDSRRKLVNAYADIPKRLKALDAAGIDAIEVVGWHNRGLDVGFPDYNFAKDAGGVKALKKALSSARSNGDRVIFNMTGQLAAEKSTFYTKKRKIGGRVIGIDRLPVRVYVGRTRCQVMCPYAQEWTTHLALYNEALRDIGADGVWLDYIACEPARLCFDKMHGHVDPGAVFGPGNIRMLDEFLKIWRGDLPGPDERRARQTKKKDRPRKYNKDATIFTEGVVDAYGASVDVHGLVSAQLLAYTLEDAPELTRYTLPGKILGHPTSSSKKDSIAEFAYAFVLGEPLLGGNLETKRIFDIYDSSPTCFYEGRFFDNIGLKGGKGRLKRGVLAAPDGRKVVLTFWNYSKTEYSGTPTFNIHDIGIKGTVTKIIDLEEKDKPVEFTGVTQVEFPLTIPADEIKALELTIE